MPACTGLAYATPSDWVEASGSLLVILASPALRWCWLRKLPSPWAVYSAATGCVVLGGILAWQAVPSPTHGSAPQNASSP